MPILVSAHELSKSFAARPLFDSITFSIESGDRIGLIGPNGAGKSTLLRILAGKMAQDAGNLSFQRGLRIGYLEQIPTIAAGSTIHQTILEGSIDPDDWESQSLAYETMSKLNLTEPDRPVAELSGGWKKRVALARELVRQPDLLLLDEPTNHLDVDSILWLEELIANARYAVLSITHDRLFLQRVSNRILELDRKNPNGLLSVPGDYAKYLETKESMIAVSEKREDSLSNTLRRETEWLRRGAKARTTKQQARISRHGDLSAEVEDLKSRNQNRTARLEFSSAERAPKKLLEAKGISKGYNGRKLFTGIDLLLTPGRRVGLLGSNGCGKSTLLRTLLGQEEPDTGTVTRADQLQVAYFEQNRETLDPQKTLLKTLCPTGDHVEFQGRLVHIRSYLDRFLFSQGQMEMAVGKLSGGEQSRILIARLMLRPANLLVLDEPTNDLDLATLAVLEDCLTDFNGAVLLVTHDRFFLDRVTDEILVFPGVDEGTKAANPTGQILSFHGLDQWEQWLRSGRKLPAMKSAPAAKPGDVPATATGKGKKLSYKDQREFDGMEAAIHVAETDLARIAAESARPENTSNSVKLSELSMALGKAQAEVDRLYARWSELEALVKG